MVLDIVNRLDADNEQRFEGRLPSLSDTEKKVLNLIIHDSCLIWTAATSFEVAAWFQS